MSTKIYEAYRFPKNKLEEFISLFNTICFEQVAEEVSSVILQDLCKNAVRKQLFGPKWRSKKINRDYDDAEIEVIWSLAEAMMMSKTGRNSRLHLDCSFNLWMKGKYAYVVPYVADCIKLEKHLPKWCEDYCYFNHSDQPEGISNKQWKQREMIWEELALEDWNRTRLTHVTLEMKLPHLPGFMRLLKMLRDDDKWCDKIYVAVHSLFCKMEEEREAKMDKRTLKAP